MKISKFIRKVLYQFSQTKPTQYQHYRILSTSYSKDLKLHLHQYQHTHTKARIYHFQNQDIENTYASIIKTYSQNDKGCPHILEHLACCGSQKFPIRDPFFNMIKRSVNTYMNAWTGEDFTSYPFATANPKDWQNLYKVYLDMSLKPKLRELDFLQQGWRYEIGPSGQRELKGIVFNQMKGAYQDSQRQLMKQINNLLFSGTPYIYDSGGKPSEIVNLQYSELKNMYEYYYHPSNMAFCFYGNNKLNKPLEYLAQQYLNKYEDKSEMYNKINLQPKQVSQKYKTIYSSTSQSNNISINYFLGLLDSISPLQVLCLKIFNYILLDKSNAQVYKKFIQSQIAQNIGHSGFNQSKMATFSVTLKGIFPNYECNTFEGQFRQMINQIIKDGLDMQRVKQVLHQFQINLLTPRKNNGIKILQECIIQMNHRLNLQPYLNLRHQIQQAAAKLADPIFVAQFLNKFFLNNKHMVVVRQLLSQKAYQQQIISSNVVKADQIIKQQQQQLQKRQNEVQNIDILPNLRLQDLIKPKRLQPQLILIKQKNEKKIEQYQIKIKDNINHYRVVFSFDKVDSSFLQKSTLWISTINRIISTKSFGYNQLTSLLANHTAGFNVFSTVGNNEEYNLIFQFSCLKKNVDKAFSLLSQIVLSPKFQKQHTINGFKSFGNEVIQELTQKPFNQCLNEASSQLTRTGAMMNSYKRIKQSLKLIKQQRIEDLYGMSLSLYQCNKIKLIQHSNQQPIKLPQFITQLLNKKGQRMESFVMESPVYFKAVTYNYMVNFCTKQFVAPKYMSVDHARINLLLQLLQQNYLHPQIRQKGGAYGSGAKIRNNGIISLYSYDDPNSLKTFNVFQNSLIQILSKDKIEENILFEAKLKQFGQVDRIKVPQDEGVNQILKQYTHEQYQTFRQSLRNSNFQQIIETGRRYLHNTQSSQCIFGKQCPQGFSQQKLKQFLII